MAANKPPRSPRKINTLVIVLAVIAAMIVSLIPYVAVNYWDYESHRQVHNSVITSHDQLTTVDIIMLVAIFGIIFGGPVIAAVIVGVILFRNKRKQ
ncbi:MAG TPA: hypothetical protein VFK03_01365 [Candidatus Saccharimonadales bacterium]|nr:hypothetical protein [Candidatus Saccharimonadales bacterium]